MGGVTNGQGWEEEASQVPANPGRVGSASASIVRRALLRGQERHRSPASFGGSKGASQLVRVAANPEEASEAHALSTGTGKQERRVANPGVEKSTPEHF